MQKTAGVRYNPETMQFTLDFEGEHPYYQTSVPYGTTPEKGWAQYHKDTEVDVKKQKHKLKDLQVASLKPGKSSGDFYKTTVAGKIIYSVFKMQKSELAALLSVAMKNPYKNVNYKELEVIPGMPSVDLPREDANRILNETITSVENFLSSIIDSSKKYAAVVVPSTSGLNKLFTNKIVSSLRAKGIEIQGLHSLMMKNDPDKVEHDTSTLENEGFRKTVEDHIESVKHKHIQENKPFSIRDVEPKYRPFVKNVFKFKRNPKELKNKTIIVLDDMISSGMSFKNIFSTLETAGFPEAMGLTIFKVM